MPVSLSRHLAFRLESLKSESRFEPITLIDCSRRGLEIWDFFVRVISSGIATVPPHKCRTCTLCVRNPINPMIRECRFRPSCDDCQRTMTLPIFDTVAFIYITTNRITSRI